MNSAIERLLQLKVKDVMSREVESVSENDHIKQAAKVLYERDVTGVPVVNALGKCVGVLSGSDYVARDAEEGPTEFFVRDGPNEPYHVEIVDTDRVRTHMTPFVQSVSAEESLVDAARLLCKEHIHRLVVADGNDRPIGVVSALDIVAATVAAVEE